MNLKIGSKTVRYNNKILVSDEKFSLGKNEKVNSFIIEPIISTPKVMNHKIIAQPTHAHELSQKPTHEEERAALILFLTGGFTIGLCFDDYLFIQTFDA